MAFGLEEIRYTSILRKLGHTVIGDDSNHRLIVDGEYEFSYANTYYFKIGVKKSIGRGFQQFLELLDPKPQPAIYFY